MPMKPTHGHHIDDTTAQAEATKIEGYIKMGDSKRAADRLRNDAAVLSDESFAHVAGILKEQNNADRNPQQFGDYKLPKVIISNDFLNGKVQVNSIVVARGNDQ